MADFGDQKEFNESLRLTNNEVHVNQNWTEETLKTISNFIKCSSSKADIIVDYDEDDDDDDWCESERFVQFLSDCLDGISSIREDQIRYTLYYKCMADFGDQKEFNESLRLTNNEVHVNQNWTEETLKTISNFIKCSSSKADIIVDYDEDDDDDDWCESERFVQFLSDCLDGISSIRCCESFLLTCSKVLYTGGQRKAKLLLKKLGQTIEIKESRLKNSSCKYLGKLMSLCRRDLSLTLTPEAITLRGLQLLCKSWRHLKTLRITDVTARLISKLIRTKRKDTSVSVKEMVILRQSSTIKGPHLISNLSIILRHWSISQLDLSSCDLEGHFVTNLLSLQGHISL
ncbi:uncharacterized protein LOC120519983, partial [Polypterus senegalus]|uniref:uncharacterized protein LOC120519983 n=1 Tax=Polypterus senegalus TaxID=55291 RepID=UPI001964737B